MTERSIPAMSAPPAMRDNPLTRSTAGLIGLGVLAALVLLCVGTLPWTLGTAEGKNAPRYNDGILSGILLPPVWATHDEDERQRLDAAASELTGIEDPTTDQIAAARPNYLLGTDKLGRSVLIRVLAGGGVSIGIGIAAATISVLIGTLYGTIAGYLGGRVDALMMRVVDVLYGLPYVLLVVLLAVAGDAMIDRFISRSGERSAYIQEKAAEVLTAQGVAASEADVRQMLKRDTSLRDRLDIEAKRKYEARPISDSMRTFFDVGILFVAIGGVSWLTMSRVIRGQVLSLKAQPFMEAARATGVPVWRQFVRHLLPNLTGPIIVYATLTVPQAILSESFLSFLGIGVKPPLPSWGNLAADGLVELNIVKVRWWLIVVPCLMLGTTLLALNFVGEGLREAFDPKRARK